MGDSDLARFSAAVLRPDPLCSRSLADRLLGGCARAALLTVPIAAVSLGITLPDEAQAQGFLVSNYSNIGPGSGLYYTSSNPTLFGGSSGAPWSVTNLGTVMNYGSGPAISLFSGTISNGGLIKSVGGSAVLISNGGTVTNTNSGTITGGSYGLHLSSVGGGRGTVVNDGTIKATAVGGSNSGIYLGGGGSVINHATGVITGTTYGLRLFGTVTVSNAGTIKGASNVGVYSENGATITNSAGAYIGGGREGILTNNGAATVTNAGHIVGSGGSANGIYLLSSGSVTNNSTGVISGVAAGIVMHGGVGTITNDGTITSANGPGVSFVDSGGTFANTLINSGSIASGGGTAVLFGNGNDLLKLLPGATFVGVVDGSGGTNTLELAAGTGSFSGLGTSFTNFGIVTVDAGASWTFTGTNTIASGVTLTNNGTMTNNGTIAGTVTLTGSGLISNAGTLTSSTGNAVDGIGSSGVSVSNSGSISGPSSYGVYFTSGGRVTNSGTASSISGRQEGVKISGGAGTVTNQGTISSTVEAGIYLTASGLVTNSGTTARITGQVAGVGVNGTGTVVNDGTITGTSGYGVKLLAAGSVTNTNGAAVISGQQGGVFIGGAGTVTNAGRIAGGTSYGVLLGAGGSVVNSGTITGAQAAVHSSSGATRVTNTGVIQATGASGVGIDLSASANSTIDNSGTISGATAIKFGAGTNELIVESGSSITGNVVGLSTANNSVVFYGSGTINQTQLINFQTVSFANATSWTLGPSVVFNSNVGVGTGTVTNEGIVNGAVTVGTSGSFANAGTVINSAGSGVFLGGSGKVTNAAGGLIQGSTYGAQLTVGGTIVNAGTILDDAIAGAALGTGSVLVNQSGGLVSGVTGVLMTGAATVFNAGTITGTGGTAVQLSAAGGTLTLQTGSVLNGAVDGGGGNGSVVLQGSGSSGNAFANFGSGGTLLMDGTAWTLGGAVAIANTTVDSGALTLSGSLTGTSVAVRSGASLLGTGSISAAVTNAGTLVPGSMSSVGTLTLTGSYTQSASGVLVVAVDSSGNASLLKVNGTANLAGTVQMVPLGSGVVAGIRYTIVTATGGVSGTFSSVSSSSPLVAFTLSYDANDVYASFGQLGLSTVGGTPNQRATAAAFDLASAVNGGALAASLSALDTLSAAGVHAALDRLSGEAYAGVATTALTSGDLFAGVIRRQSLAAASDDTSPGLSAFGGGSRVQLASLASDWAYDPAPRIDKPWGMWLSGYGQTGETSGDGNAHRLSETMSGGVVGVDYKINPQLRVGMAFGAGNTSFSLNNDGGHGSIDQTQAALYADYDWGAAYLDGLLGVAYGDGRVRRNVSLPGLPAVATGHATDTQVLSSLETGYRLALPGRMTVTPFAGLSFNSVWQNGLSESGAGALDLTVKGRTTSSVKSQLGTRLGGSFPVAGISVISDLSVGWAHDYAATSRTVTAAFGADPAATFQVEGARPGRDSAILGAGLAAPLTDQTSVYLRYDGSVDGSSSSHAVTGGVRVTW